MENSGRDSNNGKLSLLELGDYRFDRSNGILLRAGEELPLPPRALGVLSRLLDEPGSVVSKQELLESVWDGAYVAETSLSEAVGLLRQALQDPPQEPRYIQTVHRRGYRFIAPVREVTPPAAPEPEPESEPAPPGATASADAVTLPPPPHPQPRRSARPVAALAAAAAAALVTSAAYVMTRGPVRESVRPPMARFTVTPPESREPLSYLPSMAVSPDGRHIVYAARRGEEIALFHRDLSGLSSREIPGTRGALGPFFSPDGRRVGFLLGEQLAAVPLGGGAALPLVTLAGPFAGAFTGASWCDDDSVIFSVGAPAALHRVRPGGAVERLTEKDPGNGAGHFWPRVLPGADALLFTNWSTTMWDSRVEWLSLATGQRRTLLTGASDCYFAKGLLVCAKAGGTIVAAPFDPKHGRLTGPALPLLRDVAVHAGAGLAQLAVAGDTLTYLPDLDRPEDRRLQRLLHGDAGEKAVPLPAPPRLYRNFREGPGGRIAVTILDRSRSDVWVVDAANGKSSRLTFEAFNIEPVWSPDGTWVAFASNANGVFNIHRRRADGSGAVEVLTRSAREQIPLAWSPDGRELMLNDLDAVTSSDLWVLDLATRKLRPWLRTAAKETTASWSPDGKWIAYTTSDQGRTEVHVRSYPAGPGRWQVSSAGGQDPSWSADGRSIYFVRRKSGQPGRELWTVPVNPAGGELTPGLPRLVFAHGGLVKASAGPGGILFIADETPHATPKELQVILNWPSALSGVVASR